MNLSRKSTTLFLLIILIALGLHLYGIASRPIWYDEAFSLLIADKGPAAVLEATLTMENPSASADVHPPAYYFLLWAWMQLFDNSVMSTRLLSILISFGTLTLIYLLARELFDKRIALASTLFAALLPFQVHYAVEMRMYELLTFLLLLATFSFWKGMQTQRWYWWLTFSISAALSQYTHNLAAFFLVPLACTGILRKDSKTVKHTLLAGIGALLLYLPWLIHLPAQFSKIQQSYWVDRPTVASILNLFLTYVTNLPVPQKWIIPTVLVSVLVIFLAGFQTYFTFRKKTPGYRVGLWLAYLAFAPPVLLWLFSQWRPVYIERALLPAHAIFCIWLAWVLLRTALPKMLRGVILVCLLIGVGLGLSQHYTYSGFPYARYNAINRSLAARINPGDVIVHSSKLTYLPSFYFDDSLPMDMIIDEPGTPSDTLAPATRKVLGIQETQNIETAVSSAQTVWFVIFQKAIDEARSSGLSTHPQLKYLEEHFHLVSRERWDDLLIYQFSTESP